MFGERLKTARLNRGHSQDSLGQIVNVPRQQIYRWESGTVAPSSETVIMLAKALDVSADYLLGLSEELDGKIPAGELKPDEIRVVNAMRRGDKMDAIKVIVGG